MMFDDLQSQALPLFLPTPNHRQNVGSRRGDYLPNPSAQGSAFAQMYVFFDLRCCCCCACVIRCVQLLESTSCSVVFGSEMYIYVKTYVRTYRSFQNVLLLVKV